MPDKPFLQALTGQTLPRPPFWFMRQAGRYLPEYRQLREREPDFLRFCYNPDLTVEATLQPLRRYEMDAAILFSDILVVPDALGRTVRFVEGQGPLLEPLRDSDAIGEWDQQRFVVHLEPVFETVNRLTTAIPEQTALIGFAGAPWTVAVYMVEGRGGSDFSAIRRWAAADPDAFSKLMDVLIDATVLYLEQQIRYGAEAVQLFDTWAGILPQSEFRRWVIDPTKEIVRRLKNEHPTVPILGFPRAAGLQYEDYVAQTGVDGVGIDATVPVIWAAAALQPMCTVQGNLDNHLLIAGGPRLESEVERILQALATGPFVFNLGHGVLPKTPPEHVAQVADQIRAWKISA